MTRVFLGFSFELPPALPSRKARDFSSLHVWRHFSFLVDSIPLGDRIPWSSAVLVLGCSEEQSRKAGNSGALAYGLLIALGKKCFAVVGLPWHHSGCVETWSGKESFNCSPRRDNEETKWIFVLNLVLAMLTGKISLSICPADVV